jgi:hypothetical protein
VNEWPGRFRGSLESKATLFMIAKVGDRVPTVPRMLQSDRQIIERARVVLEEALELLVALQEGDMVKTVDAMCDVNFAVRGTAAVLGVDLEPFEHIVADCNLTKGSLDGQKKGGKGPLYVAPEPAIRSELRRQGWDDPAEIGESPAKAQNDQKGDV